MQLPDKLFQPQYSKTSADFRDIPTRRPPDWCTFSYETFVDLIGDTKFLRYSYDHKILGDAGKTIFRTTFLEPYRIYKRANETALYIVLHHIGPMTQQMQVRSMVLGGVTLYTLCKSKDTPTQPVVVPDSPCLQPLK
jgi:hypothetical protein